MGDFPSKASLASAEEQLTDALQRWRARGQAAPPSEVSAILRRRAYVLLRGGSPEAALADLDAALQTCRAGKSDPSVQFEELPKVLAGRGDVLAAQARWAEALADYDQAADLLGEPVEDASLLSNRARAKQQLTRWEAAAEDFDAAAEAYRRVGARAEAEIEAEHAAIALLGAGDARLADADKGLCGVIKRSIGLLSKDVALLQRVVIADCDARVAMAAVAWREGSAEVAETYWRDACARLDALVEEAQGKQLAIGFPNGETYRCDRYVNDMKWVREDRGWPDAAVKLFSTFLRERPDTAPRSSYLQDLAVGKRPGEGSTLMDLALATDVFRRNGDD